ncbi:unnamed protein product [Caretta caretta]
MLTSCTFQVYVCGPSGINHYFCDVLLLLRLSCTDTHTNEMLLSTCAGSKQLTTMLTILFSYLYITAAILRIRSSEGRHKAFSTCASHLTTVAIFYGTMFFIYLRPSSISSVEQDQVISMFYTVVIPMLNPLIYSLRNKESKLQDCQLQLDVTLQKVNNYITAKQKRPKELRELLKRGHQHIVSEFEDLPLLDEEKESSNITDRFCGDISPVLALFCLDTHVSEMLLFALVGFIVISTFLTVLISYMYILSSVLRICSIEGKPKAFPIYAAHLIAVTIFYGTLFFMYLQL